jgi:hypothetical protein
MEQNKPQLQTTQGNQMNIDDMNARQIFNVVKKHLLTQGKKSVDETGNCVYRHPDGVLKCAAGALIPDSVYKPEMEGHKWDALVFNYDFPYKKYVSLIGALQRVHDCEPPESWQGFLDDIEGNLDFFEQWETNRTKSEVV